MNYSERRAAEMKPHVDQNELNQVFQFCRSDQWKKVHEMVIKKPWIALAPMTMDNHITTTILHQAITSKGNIQQRAQLIEEILTCTPEAAKVKNGYGSLPLHVIAQRNTKIDAQTKERLIFKLIEAYEGALTQEGGPGKRTPLHIIFTDYISPRLTQFMVERGRDACFMKDKKGYLPSHVACSRHCSPEKLRMLLAVNPAALTARTRDGHTLLSLATDTATKSHPNYALIDELNLQLELTRGPLVTSESDASREHLNFQYSDKASSFHSVASPTLREVTPLGLVAHFHPVVSATRPLKRKRDATLDFTPNVVPNVDPVDLLLHFSRQGSPLMQSSNSHHGHGQFAEV